MPSGGGGKLHNAILQANLPNNHNPLPRYNAGKNESTLSLFQGQLGGASGSTSKLLGNEEWRIIMLYVLNNLTEVQPFIK
jgi:hypothetical protein